VEDVFMPTPASPDTNNFRCNACGRYLNSEAELREHEIECRRAKMATAKGAGDLKEQDRTPHLKNDQESTAEPFQHGTRTS
jgi:hypothetical protein